MPTYDANILPSTTGKDLGSPDQRWDVFSQNSDNSGNATILGTCDIGGDTTVGGTLDVTGALSVTGAMTLSGGLTANVTGDITSNGSSTFKKINGVFMADQYSGADASIKINAAIAAAVAVGGGYVDARGLYGTQTLSQQIDVGGVGTPVVLMLPNFGTWTITISNASASAFKLYDGCALISEGSGNNTLKIKMGVGASVASVITNNQSTLMQCKIQGFMVYQSNIGTVANAVVDLSKLEANSVLRDLNISTFSGIGLWLHGANSVINIENCWIDGSSTSGARPVLIETTSVSCQSISFKDGAIEHPGATKYCVEINGNGAANLSNVYFNGTHFEANSSDTTTPFVRIVDAKSIQFIGNLFNVTAVGSTAYSVQIAQTGVGLTRSITAIGILSSSAKAIDDTITTATVQKAYLNFYNYGQGNTDHDWAEINGNTFDPTTVATFPRGISFNGKAIVDSNGLLTKYANVSTAGQGIPAVFGVTSQKAETAADTNVLTFTPPAAVGTYRINFVLSLSAANAATLGWTATWKDSNGAAQAPTNLALFQCGTAAPALTFTTSAAGNYHGSLVIDVDNSATNVVVKLTFSGTSFAGKASATIERLQ